jgi:ketosteroid isomerase-like protein
MIRISSAFTAVALIALFAGPASAQSAKESIDAALLTFEQAFNSGDAAAVATHYTEDAALLPPDAARVDGSQSIFKFWLCAF